MLKINRLLSMRSIFVCLLVLLCICAAAAAYAQTDTVCPCVQIGLDLLENYNVPPTALNTLLPALNDPLMLANHLQNLGMDAITSDNFMADFTPLVREAHLTPGAVQDFAAQGVRALFTAKLTDTALNSAVSDLLAAKDDNAVKDIFTKNGLSQSDAATALSSYKFYVALGFNEAANDHWLKKNPVYATQTIIDRLFYKGVPLDNYSDLIALHRDQNSLNAALVKLNLNDKDVRELVQIIQRNDANGFDETAFSSDVAAMKQQLVNLDKALDPDGDGKLGGGQQPSQPKH